MLINGQTAGNTPSEILGQLSSLKSNFAEYISTKLSYNPQPNINNLYNEGQELLSQGQTTKALQQFQTIERIIPKDQPNNYYLAPVYSQIATIQSFLGQQEKATVNFQKSVDVYMRNKEYYNAEIAYKNLAGSHQTNGTLKAYEKENKSLLESSLSNKDQSQELRARLALGAINRVQGKHKEALEHYAVCYDLQQGGVNYDADRVEQHEVGFSDKKIGTDNIQQCVAVILHDPITKKTALAHVDRYTDATSLSQVVANFPEGTKLDAYLVGGLDRSAHSKAVSDDNIARVIGELNKHQTVDIKSADIGDKGAPSGIVFDPQTAKLEHSVPGKHHKTTDARKAALNILVNAPTSLHFAFDLTKSTAMQSPPFSDRDKELLVQRYLNTPKIAAGNGIEMWYANTTYDPLAKTAEKIRQENPKIVEAAIEKYLGYRLEQSIPIEQQRQKIKNDLLKTVKGSLKDFSKPFDEIQKELEKNIQKNTSKQEQSTWNAIKNTAVKARNNLKEIVNNIKSTVKNIWQTVTGRRTAQSQQHGNPPPQQHVRPKPQELDKPEYSADTVKAVEQLRNQSMSRPHSNVSSSTPQTHQQSRNKSHGHGNSI